MAYLSVPEAAERLGVIPARIRERIKDGSLRAEKIGRDWVISEADLAAVPRHASPGRPLSPRSAWNLLAVASADASLAVHLSPPDRSRARSRLRNLLAHAADSDDLDAAASLLRHTLRNRAERSLYVASPRDLPDLRADERVHVSGVSLPESNMSAADMFEGYVIAADLDGVVDDYLLSPGDRARSNVVLHVVSDAVRPELLAALSAVSESRLALAADLAEHDGVREKNEAVRSVADLHAWFVANGAHVVGGRRE